MNRLPEEELEKARAAPDGATGNGERGAAASGAGDGAREAQGDAPGGPEPASGDGPESGAKEDEPQSLVEEIKEDIKEGIEHVKEEIQEGIEHVKEEIQEGIEHVQEGIEQVKEEIEQVVEHVPKPVRWGVKRILWAAALSLGALLVLLIVTAILYVANRTEWAAGELTLIINQTLARRSDVEFVIRDIKGNPFTGVRLLDASVRFREGDQPPLLAAQVIRVNYDALRLLRGHGAITLDIEQPVVRLGYGDDGKLRMPRWKSEPRAKPPAAGKGFDIRVRIARGSLRLPRPMEGIEQLTLDARLETGGAASATIERMSWARGPWGSVLQSLRGEIVDGDSVRCLVRELKTGDVELRGHAAWKRGAVERVIAVDVDRVRWAWLARVFKNGVLDVPGEGRFIAHAVGGPRWRGDFAGAFSWNGLDLDGNGRFEGGREGWTVEPLTARSKAGDLSGRFVYDPANWEVRGDVRHGQPRLWDALRLPGWPAGDLNGWFRYAVAAQGPDEMEARLVGSELAGWRADSARVWMWFPDDVPDSFRVVLARRGGESTLDAVLFPGGWGGRYRIARMPLDEWPDGRASGLTGLVTKGEGPVEARHGELYVGGTLQGVATDWLGARIESWRLDQIAGRLLPAPDLECSAVLGSTTFLGVHFDSAAAGLELGDRAMEIADLAANAGDTLLTAAGRAAWGTDRWSITFDRAAAHSDQFDWTADPPVALSGDPQGVVFARLAMRDRGSRLDFSGRWAGPGGAYSFRARGDRLDLSRLGLPLELGLEGVTDVTLAVDGMYGAPRWHMDGIANRLGVRGQRADSVALEIGGGAGRLEVQSLSLTLADGAVEAHGRVERAPRAWPDTLTADGVLEWLADAAFWEGSARATSLALERVQGMLSPASGWGGRLDATIEVAGSPAHPEMDVRAEASPLSWRDYRVDQVLARAEYRDGRLGVEQIQVTRAGVQSSASGEVPMRLRLGSKLEFPDQAMTFKVDIPSGDLAVFPLFVPQLGSASGHFDMSARVGGTARRPLLSGNARVRGGVVRLAGREEELRSLDADFRLDPSGIHLDSLRARQGDRGWVTGAGVVGLKGLALDGYRFDLVLRDFTAHEIGLYTAEFDGRFAVTNGERVRGQTLPHVSGTVEMRHAVILLDFANQTETERLAATTQPLFWTYRVQVNATSNLHWQPPDGDIDFSADLMLEQTPDSLIVYGDMSALRGTYYFLSNRFDVRQADLTFDNLEGVNPLLDIEATTRVKQPAATCAPGPRADDVAAQRGVSNGPQEISARITGRANEPVVAFSSSPDDWDEPCILRELTFGRFQDVKGGISGDPLDSYVTQAINRTLSAEMSRTFKGYVNEWVLERERGGLLTGEGDLIVGVGVPVNRNLQIRYRQRVPGLEREYGTAGKPEDPFERNVEAEYRLNRFFFVTTELKQRRILTGSSGSVVATPDFNINLKARWEY